MKDHAQIMAKIPIRQSVVIENVGIWGFFGQYISLTSIYVM